MNTPLLPPDDESTTATGTLAADNAAIELAAHWNGPCCEKCNAPMKSDAVAVCRRCGWYARLGQYVEVDQAWESYDDDAEQSAPAAAPSHLEVWAKLLPTWAWAIVATVAAVAVESIAVRLLTAEGGAVRTVWSVTQLAVGVFVFLGCHLFNFLMVASDDPDFGALDLVLRPLRVWMRTFSKLPKWLVVTDGAAAGLAAVLMSIIVIGALPYDRLWDWGFKQPPKQNLMGAVMSQIQKVEGQGADNLEDAVGDFAGKQNLDDDKKGKTPPPPLKPRMEVDCVILGYRVDSEGRLLGFLLGTAYKDKLVYACTVSPKLAPEEAQDLVDKLSEVRSDQPYITTQAGALWVKPAYACRVSCEKQEANGRLVRATWKEFLGEL
jgi:hypothetical protein